MILSYFTSHTIDSHYPTWFPFSVFTLVSFTLQVFVFFLIFNPGLFDLLFPNKLLRNEMSWFPLLVPPFVYMIFR